MTNHLEEVVRRARLGDPRAFRTLVEHLTPQLEAYLRRKLQGDLHAAADVLQEVFLRLWDELPALGSLSHARRWCYRVAHCKAVSWIRRQAPPGRRMQTLDAPSSTPGPLVATVAEAGAGEDDLVHAVRRAVRTLPSNYEGPVRLHYLQGIGTRETARLLGLRHSALKMRLHRARRYLYRKLERDRVERGQSVRSGAPPSLRAG